MPSQNDITKQQVRLTSHEIKNQLSITDIYCEIIKKQLIKNGIENEAIDRALQCIQRSTKLISNSLLDLKTLTNIELRPENIYQIIEESIELGKTYIYDKKIDISYNSDTDIKIAIDKNKLEACIINLIKNAAEAIETEGFIKISTLASEKTFKIIIANNGTAIPESERNKIFQDGHTTKQNGSGIGLYLSRENLRKMGGDLKLNNSKLTEFEIILKI